MTNNSDKLITLAEQKFGQLTDVDRKLFEAVARHEVVNFKADRKRRVYKYTIKADLIVWLLTTPEVIEQISFKGYPC